MWFTLSAVAATWNIPGDYPTIADAVASGTLVDGDELLLAAQDHPGADLSQLTTATELVIRGVAGAVIVPDTSPVGTSPSVIDSGSLALTLQDLEIDGQLTSRGLLVQSGALVTLQDVVVRNGFSNSDGGGVLVQGDGVLWSFSSEIYDCESSNNGGGIATANGGTIDGNGLRIERGLADQGGALYLDPQGTYDVPNTLIADSVANTDGGGAYLEGSFTAYSSTIRDNTSGRHGGGLYANDGSVTLFASRVGDNVADNEGGGFSGRAAFQMQATFIDGNVARKAGAARIESGAQPSYFDDVAFCGNSTVEDEAHALRIDSNQPVLFYQTLFAFNGTPGNTGETIRNNGQLYMGFGLFYANEGTYALDSDNSVDLMGMVFAGGGLRTQGGMAANQLVANAFDPNVAIDSQVDLSTQLVVDPMVVDLGGCDPYDFFPYASNPALLDQVLGEVDDDGSVADVGHLGGQNVGQGFWGADEDDDDAYIHVDCDDADPSRYPGAPELCDGVDNDCDGLIDENGGLVYPDSDGDGFGDQNATAQPGCVGPGLVADNTDCDDADDGVNPGQPQDLSCDGTDDDCDGFVDEDAVVLTYFPDTDGDGYGDDASAGIDSCEAVAGHVTNDIDCDDSAIGINPGAAEVCDGVDNDCAGGVDDGLSVVTSYQDGDGDGFGDPLVSVTTCEVPAGYVVDDTDCDDSAASVNPAASEQCDAIDHDCTGLPDDGVATTDWWPDSDGDGYGDALAAVVSDCAAPSPAHVTNGDDCDDTDDGIRPDAAEVCDAIDHDCDGDPVNGVPLLSWYLDVDNDGYGAGAAVLACSPPANHVGADGDCAPGDGSVYPGADEVCDSQDNDCDALVDDDDDTVVDAPAWYPDTDQDTWGDPDGVVFVCTAPPGHVAREGDCDDTQPNVYQGAPEACVDGLDNDCDTLIDDADPDYSFTGVEYGEDSDGDGYGWPLNTEVACSGEQTLGWVPMSQGEDCDDGQSTVFPGAPEVCNGIDDDCDGGIDDGLAFLDYFVDDDGDTFGNPNLATVNACARPEGRVGNGLDCDDADPDRHPLALEVCNGIDDNCNSLPDDGLDSQDYYPDLDEDGFGDLFADPITDCAPVEDHVLDHTDCDDDDATIFPGAEEDPIDGIDSDCDGADEEIPQPVIDTDGDGIPDAIDNDPNDAGDYEAGPEPSSKDYGCGCQAQDRSGLGWMGLLRR